MKPAEYAVMRAVEDRHWWYRGLRGMIRRMWPEPLREGNPWILDAGCGTGANLRLLRALSPGARLIGLDRAAEALPGECVGVGWCRGDANHLPLAAEQFDAVLATDLLGQAGVDGPGALAHLLRVLKPGGVLLVNVPAFPWLRGEHDQAVHVVRRFTPGELRKELLDAGFERITLRPWNCLLLGPMWVRRRLHPPRAGTVDAHSDLTLAPAFFNMALSAWLQWETLWAASVGCPVGSSLFAVATKASRSRPSPP